MPRSAALVLGALAFAPALVIAPSVVRSAGALAQPADAPTFVGSATCGGCHQSEMAAWRGSHHDLAMQEATAETVLGDFDDASFSHGGVTSRFFKRDGRFFVTTDGPDGKLADFEIRYTFGVYPLQQYLIAFPDGRLQALGIAWDARPEDQGGQRWFHLYPDQNPHAGDPLHWTGIDQTWNFMCAECHSTELRKNYDAATNTYATTWAEIDVGCETCHGPGSAHVAWAGRQQSRLPWSKGGDDGLMVHFDERAGIHWTIDPATGNATRSAPRTSAKELETCGICHSRSAKIAEGWRPGRAASRDPRAGPAGAGPVRGGRQDGGRGLQLRLVPSEQDVHAGRQLQRLPRPAFAAASRRGQRRLLPVPRRGQIRRGRASPPCGGLAGHGLPGLPHAGADLHGGRPAPRSWLPHPAAGSVGALRRLQQLQRLPRRPGCGLGGGRDRALVRAGAQGLSDLDRGAGRGAGRHGGGRRAVAAARDRAGDAGDRARDRARGSRPIPEPRGGRRGAAGPGRLPTR